MPFPPNGTRFARRRFAWIAALLVMTVVGAAAMQFFDLGLPAFPLGGGSVGPELVAASVGFAWPEFHGRLDIEGEDLAALHSLLEDIRPRAGAPEPREILWNVHLDLSDGSDITLYVTQAYRLYTGFGEDGSAIAGADEGSPAHPEDDGAGPWWETGMGVEWVGSGLKEWVRTRVRRLEAAFFGELLTWPEVRAFFPVGGTGTVRDLESGKTFQVRRHRGDSHADVEPLTADDAATLKSIYGGEWSWKRRAVVLSIGDRHVAGSMNGMPHGWGDLFANDFVGHSCIHFWQSRVHGTWKEDPGHQLQVIKASGRLPETLDRAGPVELAVWAVAAVNHLDVVALRYLAGADALLRSDPEDAFSFTIGRLTLPIRHIAQHGARLVEEGERAAAVLVTATVYFHEPDPDRGFARSVVVRLEREDPSDPWTIVLESLLPLSQRFVAEIDGDQAVSAVSLRGDSAALADAIGC